MDLPSAEITALDGWLFNVMDEILDHDAGPKFAKAEFGCGLLLSGSYLKMFRITLLDPFEMVIRRVPSADMENSYGY
jgi:hypothetical protein